MRLGISHIPIICLVACFNTESVSLSVLPAAGAVCAERVHPVGAGSGGLGLQTLLSASAGSG